MARFRNDQTVFKRSEYGAKTASTVAPRGAFYDRLIEFYTDTNKIKQEVPVLVFGDDTTTVGYIARAMWEPYQADFDKYIYDEIAAVERRKTVKTGADLENMRMDFIEALEAKLRARKIYSSDDIRTIVAGASVAIRKTVYEGSDDAPTRSDLVLFNREVDAVRETNEALKNVIVTQTIPFRMAVRVGIQRQSVVDDVFRRNALNLIQRTKYLWVANDLWTAYIDKIVGFNRRRSQAGDATLGELDATLGELDATLGEPNVALAESIARKMYRIAEMFTDDDAVTKDIRDYVEYNARMVRAFLGVDSAGVFSGQESDVIVAIRKTVVSSKEPGLDSVQFLADGDMPAASVKAIAQLCGVAQTVRAIDVRGNMESLASLTATRASDEDRAAMLDACIQYNEAALVKYIIWSFDDPVVYATRLAAAGRERAADTYTAIADAIATTSYDTQKLLDMLSACSSKTAPQVVRAIAKSAGLQVAVLPTKADAEKFGNGVIKSQRNLLEFLDSIDTETELWENVIRGLVEGGTRIAKSEIPARMSYTKFQTYISIYASVHADAASETKPYTAHMERLFVYFEKYAEKYLSASDDDARAKYAAAVELVCDKLRTIILLGATLDRRDIARVLSVIRRSDAPIGPIVLLVRSLFYFFPTKYTEIIREYTNPSYKPVYDVVRPVLIPRAVPKAPDGGADAGLGKDARIFLDVIRARNAPADARVVGRRVVLSRADVFGFIAADNVIEDTVADSALLAEYIPFGGYTPSQAWFRAARKLFTAEKRVPLVVPSIVVIANMLALLKIDHVYASTDSLGAILLAALSIPTMTYSYGAGDLVARIAEDFPGDAARIRKTTAKPSDAVSVVLDADGSAYNRSVRETRTVVFSTVPPVSVEGASGMSYAVKDAKGTMWYVTMYDRV